MAKQLATLTILGLLLFEHCVCTCLNAETSEGFVVLKEGQRACAPLRRTETVADKGKRFVTCSHDKVFVQYCPTELRFDTNSGTCNWPDSATCEPAAPPTGPPPTLPSNPPRSVRPPPTGQCSNTNCQLPDCFCFGSRPNITPLETQPMFIMLSFDGRVSSYYFENYFRPLLFNPTHKLVNPDGCPAKLSFYLSHQISDYTKVMQLWQAGHEIASYTVHGRLPPGVNHTDYTAVDAEINGLKQEIFKATGNRLIVDSVKGFRAPNLHMAFNAQFDVLSDYHYKYDSSILNTIVAGKAPYWPFTLDFSVPECGNPPCPTKQYPGLWEVPVTTWIGDDHEPCPTIDTCTIGTSPWMATEQQWYDFFKRHFESYFYATKTPMPISIPSSMFDKYNFFPALVRWLRETLQTKSDVWLVTPQQLLPWMASPDHHVAMKEKKWGC